MTQDTLRDQDLRHLWHPYTDIGQFETNPYTVFQRAEGVYLYERSGRPVLDGISSWWAVALGHSHPKVVEAIREQAGVLQHSILGNLSHPLAVQLAERLAALCPGDLNRVYFACDGASATESAMKIAIQYWANMGETGRDQFVCLQDGYHGDTLGAIRVGFVPQFHRHFEGAIRRAYTADSPHCTCCAYDKEEDHCALNAFASMDALVREHHEELAGVILEPLCQGAAGIRIYPAEYLRRVRALCDEFGLLLIADEIAVGFGRTGSLFACEKAGITPDVLCVGKALTAGYLPMSAVIATDKVYEGFRSDAEHDRTFYDGHTFCGNPITAAAALAAIEVYIDEGTVENSKDATEVLHRGMSEIAAYPCVEYVKTLGMIGMCGFSEEEGGATLAREVTQHAMELGLFIRPLGEVLYLWPPLISTVDEMGQMVSLFKAAIEQAMDKS